MYTKKKILSIMKELYEDSRCVLFGEQCNIRELPITPIERYQKFSGGHRPGILGIELACYGLRLPEVGVGSEKWNTIIEQLTDYAKAGGIITASSHFTNPMDKAAACRGKFGGEEAWEEMLTEGSELNKIIKEELIIDGKFLKELDDRGIPVLWRPLHEINGGWFWFCGRSHDDMEWIDPSYVRRFWKYIYDLYTVEFGMKNLIWVYSPNVCNHPGMKEVLHYYPGDEYVDIMGVDWYTGGGRELNYPGHSYDKIMSLGKVCAITEYGANGRLLIRDGNMEKQRALFSSTDAVEIIRSYVKQGLKIAYVLTWTWGCGSLPSLGNMDDAFKDPFCLTLERLNARYGK